MIEAHSAGLWRTFCSFRLSAAEQQRVESKTDVIAFSTAVDGWAITTTSPSGTRFEAHHRFFFFAKIRFQLSL